MIKYLTATLLVMLALPMTSKSDDDDVVRIAFDVQIELTSNRLDLEVTEEDVESFKRAGEVQLVVAYVLPTGHVSDKTILQEVGDDMLVEIREEIRIPGGKGSVYRVYVYVRSIPEAPFRQIAGVPLDRLENFDEPLVVRAVKQRFRLGPDVTFTVRLMSSATGKPLMNFPLGVPRNNADTNEQGEVQVTLEEGSSARVYEDSFSPLHEKLVLKTLEWEEIEESINSGEPIVLWTEKPAFVGFFERRDESGNLVPADDLEGSVVFRCWTEDGTLFRKWTEFSGDYFVIYDSADDSHSIAEAVTIAVVLNHETYAIENPEGFAYDPDNIQRRFIVSDSLPDWEVLVKDSDTGEAVTDRKAYFSNSPRRRTWETSVQQGKIKVPRRHANSWLYFRADGYAVKAWNPRHEFLPEVLELEPLVTVTLHLDEELTGEEGSIEIRSEQSGDLRGSEEYAAGQPVVKIEGIQQGKHSLLVYNGDDCLHVSTIDTSDGTEVQVRKQDTTDLRVTLNNPHSHYVDPVLVYGNDVRSGLWMYPSNHKDEAFRQGEVYKSQMIVPVREVEIYLSPLGFGYEYGLLGRWDLSELQVDGVVELEIEVPAEVEWVRVGEPVGEDEQPPHP